MMNLQQSMKSFVAVVEERGFAAAARKLFCSSPKISKDISWLEGELDVCLLNRTTRKLNLTEAGSQFYQYAKQSLQNYTNIKQQFSEQKNQISGCLRMTCSSFFYECCLTTPVSKFLKRYPKIRLEVNLCSEFLDLQALQIDLAIRTSNPMNILYQVQPLTSIKRGIFAAPSYIKKYGAPKHPDDLRKHMCLLHNDISKPQHWLLRNGQRVIVSPRYICNSIPALIHAATNGLGCVYFSRHHIREELADGRLQEVLADFSPEEYPIYICYQKQDFIPKKVSVFIGLLQEQIKSLL